MLPGNLEEMEKQSGEKIHGSLLIFLVTCLIVALSVVVLFLAIKLRRAHIHWKRGKHWGNTIYVYTPFLEHRGLSFKMTKWIHKRLQIAFVRSYLTKDKISSDTNI